MTDIFVDIEKLYVRFIAIREYLIENGVPDRFADQMPFEFNMPGKFVKLAWLYRDSSDDEPVMWLNIEGDGFDNICFQLYNPCESATAPATANAVEDENDSKWVTRGLMRYNSVNSGDYFDHCNNIKITSPFTEEKHFQLSTLHELRWEHCSYKARLDFVEKLPIGMSLNVLGEKRYGNFCQGALREIECGFTRYEHVIRNLSL